MSWLRRAKETKETIVNLFKTSILFRILSTTFLGALGGSTFIAFINRYALFNYSLGYGARLPVESVPYINVAVSILSFVFLSVSLLVSIGLYFYHTFVFNRLEKLGAWIKTKLKDKKGEKKSLFFQLFRYTNLVAAFISTAISGFSLIGAVRIAEALGTASSLFINYSWALFLIIVMLAFLSLYPKMAKWFALTFVSLSICFITVRMFELERYTSFLREMRYGGGIQATVVVKDGTDQIQETGFLFLTTTNEHVLYIPEEDAFVELPKSKTVKISLEPNTEPKMPKQTGSLMKIFQHLW